MSQYPTSEEREAQRQRDIENARVGVDSPLRTARVVGETHATNAKTSSGNQPARRDDKEGR